MVNEPSSRLRPAAEILKKRARSKQGKLRCAGFRRMDQDTRELIVHLKNHMAEGLSEDEIAQAMGFNMIQSFRSLVARMYEAEEEILRGRTPAQVFIDLAINQRACARRLDEVATKCLETNQAAGAVGAIKAKADLYDRLLTRGQELGVLAKRPKEVRVLGRIDVAHMTTEELRRQVEAENAALVKLAASLDAPAADRALLVEAAGGNGNGNDNDPAPKPVARSRARGKR